VADRILSAEAGIGVTLPENGYPFVKVGQRDVLLDAAARTGDYTLPVTPGPRSKFGDIVMEGKKRVFKPKHVATIARFKKGELYDSRKVDDLRKALVATNLYSVVTVEPQQTGTASARTPNMPICWSRSRPGRRARWPRNWAMPRARGSRPPAAGPMPTCSRPRAR
jgi:outer membrane translocation and assembly module TamA